MSEEVFQLTDLVLTERFKTELSLTGFIGNTLYSCDKCGTFISISMIVQYRYRVSMTDLNFT